MNHLVTPKATRGVATAGCARAIFTLVLGVAAATGAGAQDQSRYTWQRAVPQGGQAGAVALSDPYGGEFVYTQKAAPGPKLSGRLVLGPRARTDFTLFSSDEEAALWKLREDQLAAQRSQHLASGQHPLRVHARPRKFLVVDWPRVTDDDARTCVPQAAFAQAPNWRDHLVCWLKGARRVE